VTELDSRRPGQRAKQRIEEDDIPLPHWWELQKDGAETRTKRRHSLAKDSRQANAVESFRRIGEASVRLHTKAEFQRRFRRPLEER
jgi:hypothetical protein